MIRGAGIRAALLAATAALLLVPAGSARAATGISLDVHSSKQVKLLKKVRVAGKLVGAAPGEVVTVRVAASGRQLFSETLTPSGNGSFGMPLAVDSCCRYVVTAESGPHSASDGFQVKLPKKLGKGKLSRLFNRSLQAQGFHTGTKGKKITRGTRLAIKAFRKTNKMSRSYRYSKKIFRKLLTRRGAFKPRYKKGRHVEVDLSRQVMSLVQGDKPKHTFHISSGTSRTPTIRGKYRFHRHEAGYNNKRMYFTVYFQGGYAIHGFNPVPNHPASHGCVRNPIPFSRFIYNWVSIGMPIYVYK